MRQQIEQLRPLKDKTESLERSLEAHKAQRRNLVVEWEEIIAAEYRQIEKAARQVSKKLGDRVQVTVKMAGNREPLEQLLREVGGNLSAALARLRGHDQLSLREFAQRCREGKNALIAHYNLPAGAAERIAQADPDLLMRIEELELPATTEIKLNTAADGKPPHGKRCRRFRRARKQRPSYCSCCLNRKHRCRRSA